MGHGGNHLSVVGRGGEYIGGCSESLDVYQRGCTVLSELRTRPIYELQIRRNLPTLWQIPSALVESGGWPGRWWGDRI
jgi:hypothetical protein